MGGKSNSNVSKSASRFSKQPKIWIDFSEIFPKIGKIGKIGRDFSEIFPKIGKIGVKGGKVIRKIDEKNRKIENKGYFKENKGKIKAKKKMGANFLGLKQVKIQGKIDEKYTNQNYGNLKMKKLK